MGKKLMAIIPKKSVGQIEYLIGCSVIFQDTYQVLLHVYSIPLSVRGTSQKFGNMSKVYPSPKLIDTKSDTKTYAPCH